MIASGASRACIGLGSNLAGPAKQLREAVQRIAQIANTEISAVSALYRSGPLGGIEQPDFLNAATMVATGLSPQELLSALQHVEEDMGRDRGVARWGPRRIDLDLLVFDSVIVDEPELTIPHPGIASRNFVLLPLRDIDPGLVVPGLGRVSDLPLPTEPDVERISDKLWHTGA